MGIRQLGEFADVVMSDYPTIWCVNYDERRGLATYTFGLLYYFYDFLTYWVQYRLSKYEFCLGCLP
jgi:hypothetical protein